MTHSTRRPPTIRQQVSLSLVDASRLYKQLARSRLSQIVRMAELLLAALKAGRKVIWFGNGGSATQSQHMAAELVGRFVVDRTALPSISLTENMASVTAIGNDYGYDALFTRQLEGLAQAGDVAVGLSTSGSSPNVLAGLRKAKELGLITIGLTGGSGGKMAAACDLCLVVPSPVTARIQEAHLAIGHIVCGLIEQALFPKKR